MGTHSWEMVAPGRYATEYQGRLLQAIRKDGPYERDARPYLAVVDRVPLEPGEWSLNRAKTKAIQHVERQNGRAKAERIFKPSSIVIPEPQTYVPHDPVDTLLAKHERDVEGVLEFPAPEPEVPPRPESVEGEPEPEVQEPEPQPVAAKAMLFVTLTDPDLLKAINALKETLELMREFAEVRCTITLPPTLEL